MQFVVCAAMKMKDGNIIPGIRHYSPEMRITLKRIYGDKYHKQVEEQGFVDQKGNFLSRKEAWRVADRAGQIRRETGWEQDHEWNTRPANVGDEQMLFSENLY